IKSLDDLLKPNISVGLADPEQSALGLVTRDLLERRDLFDALERSGNRKISSPTGDYLVSQILAGAGHAVIVYRSNARANPKISDKLELRDIADKKARATQRFAIAQEFDHKYLLERLLVAIRSEESQKRFKELGFTWRDEIPKSK